MINLSDLTQLKILLIESNQNIRDTLVKAFFREGCSLTTAISATGGMRLVKEDCYDIIISDFDLPAMDGFEFFKLAKDYCQNSVKIIIAAYGDIDPMSNIFKYGINDIIEKPFPFESLLYTISKHIEKKSATG